MAVFDPRRLKNNKATPSARFGHFVLPQVRDLNNGRIGNQLKLEKRDTVKPERWKVDKILRDLLDHAPDQRARIMDEACAGDASLRQHVEDLLHSHEQPTDFLRTVRLSPTGQTLDHVMNCYHFHGMRSTEIPSRQRISIVDNLLRTIAWDRGRIRARRGRIE